jgi:hypothetical protein
VGNASFDSQNEALLFQLLPIVKLVVPVEATRLLSRYASLRNAPAITVETPVVLIGVVSLEGTADTARMQSRADESRVYKVQSTAEADPKEALSVARRISDPYLQMIALVSLAPAYSKVDTQEADLWLSDGESQLGSVIDSGKKLRLMAAVVRARDMRDKPDELGYSVEGYDELTELTMSVVKAEANQTATISRIGKVKNDVLRAALLISAARGISEN